MGEWWRWALVSPDVVTPTRLLVCLPPLISPYTIESRSFFLAPAHPGGPGKRVVKWLWWWWFLRIMKCYWWQFLQAEFAHAFVMMLTMFCVQSGFTPLHIAAHYGSLDVATLLLDNGADIDFSARVCISYCIC